MVARHSTETLTQNTPPRWGLWCARKQAEVAAQFDLFDEPVKVKHTGALELPAEQVAALDTVAPRGVRWKQLLRAARELADQIFDRADGRANFIETLKGLRGGWSVETQSSWPGHQCIANAQGWNPKTVQRHLRAMEEAGLIACIKVGTEWQDGTRWRSEYVFLNPDKLTTNPSPAPVSVEELSTEVKCPPETKNYYRNLAITPYGDTEKLDETDTREESTLRERCRAFAWRLKNEVAMFRDVSIKALMAEFKEDVRQGSTLADVLHTIEWHSLGFAWPFTGKIKMPLALARWRRRNWKNEDGSIKPTPRQTERKETATYYATPVCPEHGIGNKVRPFSENGYGGCAACRTDHLVGWHTDKSATCAVCESQPD